MVRMEDFTERKRIDMALQASESKYRSLYRDTTERQRINEALHESKSLLFNTFNKIPC